MEKKGFGLSCVLISYSFASLILSSIIACNTECAGGACLRTIIFVVLILNSICAMVYSVVRYDKVVKKECKDKKSEIEKLIEENVHLKGENNQLKETSIDKTDEDNRLKLLREHEERMAIIKALGANYSRMEEGNLKQKLDEIINELRNLKQS